MWGDQAPLVLAALALGMALVANRRASLLAADWEGAGGRGEQDPLTGLANRVALAQRLKTALHGARRSGKRLAVLFLDLDGFKAVNDLHGHHTGDAIIVQVAEALAAAVRKGDLLARLGGDEFVVVCEGLDSPTQAEVIADRISLALGTPFRHGDLEVVLTASVGIVVSTGRDATSETLLRDADAAMYRAKCEGRGRKALFEPEMARLRSERTAREHRLRQAVDNEELRVYYQPIVRVSTEQLVGVEALLRWQHPERGLVPPAEFVDVLEETGLIVPAGAWALRHACAQVARWQQQYALDPDFHVAVNVSGVQLARPSFADTVSRALDEAGADPRQLCLEITEQALMGDLPAAWAGLRRVKSLGVWLSLDDFGTGYSSLSYVRNFALDLIKIDRSFVRSLTSSGEDAAIVEAVVSMAHALELGCVAEGVETQEQLERLRELECDLAQGYLFSEPQPPEVIDVLLAHMTDEGITRSQLAG